MDLRANQLLSLLIDLEMHLRTSNLWQESTPPQEALASTQPFCVDTLEFQQWLQFVFIPRLRSLAEAGQPLPSQCNVAPMVIEGLSASEEQVKRNISKSVEVIDQLLTN